MRKKDREIQDRTEVDRIIGEAAVCRLGLCKDNRPYVVPVSFGYDGGSVYFHTPPAGMMIDYLEANDAVCFEMEHDVRMLPDEDSACRWSVSYVSVIGFGRVREVTAPEEKIAALGSIMRQYSGKAWNFDAAAVGKTRIWRIVVESLTGRQSKDRITSRS